MTAPEAEPVGIDPAAIELPRTVSIDLTDLMLLLTTEPA
jgi:hypothetical protein